MARKGFSTVDQVRGLLAVPTGADQAAHERGGYVTAMQRANAGLYDPLVTRPSRPIPGVALRRS
jgi:dihydroorotate dehydrogenase (fumarate)